MPGRGAWWKEGGLKNSTVLSADIKDLEIVNADLSASAAIAFSKLAALTSANILVGSASNVATAVAVTGDVTISNAGVTAIATDVIVNADVKSDAAIAYSKLSLASSIVTTDLVDGSTGKAIKNSATAVTVGADSAYGTEVIISPATGFSRIEPQYGLITYGGTFDTETVTVTTTVTYDDDTTATNDQTATATGTDALDDAIWFALATNGKNIKQIGVKAKSTHATSTTATVALDLLAHSRA